MGYSSHLLFPSAMTSTNNTSVSNSGSSMASLEPAAREPSSKTIVIVKPEHGHSPPLTPRSPRSAHPHEECEGAHMNDAEDLPSPSSATSSVDSNPLFATDDAAVPQFHDRRLSFISGIREIPTVHEDYFNTDVDAPSVHMLERYFSHHCIGFLGSVLIFSFLFLYAYCDRLWQ